MNAENNSVVGETRRPGVAMTRQDELEVALSDLDWAYLAAARAARDARSRGADPTPHWRACQGYFSRAKAIRSELLLATWETE